MSVLRCRELFLQGYNCAQAVAGGFAEEMGLSEEKAIAVASCFGAGICATRNVCGAVTGGLMVLGAVAEKTSPDEKKAVYDLGKAFMDKFGEKFSTVTCKELLTKAKAHFSDAPLARNEEYYRARPCLIFVEEVAKELEEIVKNR